MPNPKSNLERKAALRERVRRVASAFRVLPSPGEDSRMPRWLRGAGVSRHEMTNAIDRCVLNLLPLDYERLSRRQVANEFAIALDQTTPPTVREFRQRMAAS